MIGTGRVGVSAMLTYYDRISQRHYLKPRYKWAIWAFVAGMAFGVIMAWLT
jgi:hypothetical protein